MGILIDTSILIESEHGRLDIHSHVAAQKDDDIFISVITVSELLHGVHRAQDPIIKNKRLAITEAVIEQFSVLEIDLPTARAHSQIWAQLESVGQIVGPHDLWLAATCLSRDLKIVTANVREFARVPGLSVENWAAD